MITLSATSRTYGNTSQYIARISGKDPKYGFSREFTGKKDRSSTTAYVDEPGLYETCDIDKKGRKSVTCAAVIPRPADCPPMTNDGDPDLMRFWLTDPDAAAIASRLDKGEKIDAMIEVAKSADGTGYEYRLRKPGEAKKASAAATIDQAVEQCWQVLQSFPEREAKKVLAALKLRVSPKPVAETAPPTPVAETTGSVSGETQAAQ